MKDLTWHYDRISWAYDVLDWPFEHFRYRHLRPLLCADMTGHVLEAGVGTGRNLPYYPAETRITGIDTSRAQVARARRRGRRRSVVPRIEVMDVTALAFPDASFDGAVATFLFCVLPDELQHPALCELLRVVRPGGRILLLEYVYSQRPFRRFVQKIMAPYTEAIFGARFDRTTAEAVARSRARVLRDEFVHLDMLRLFELQV